MAINPRDKGALALEVITDSMHKCAQRPSTSVVGTSKRLIDEPLQLRIVSDRIAEMRRPDEFAIQQLDEAGRRLHHAISQQAAKCIGCNGMALSVQHREDYIKDAEEYWIRAGCNQQRCVHDTPVHYAPASTFLPIWSADAGQTATTILTTIANLPDDMRATYERDMNDRLAGATYVPAPPPPRNKDVPLTGTEEAW